MKKVLIGMMVAAATMTSYAGSNCDLVVQMLPMVKNLAKLPQDTVMSTEQLMEFDSNHPGINIKKWWDECEADKAAVKERRAESDRLAALPGVKIGMTAKQVIEETSWGKPTKINQTITKRGTDEQWVYEGGSYLYLTKGKVTTIQN